VVARAGLLVVLLASLVASPADAARREGVEPGPGLPTPELLDRAVGRGNLTRATADRYLALALRDHRRVPDRFLSAVPWDGTIPLLRLRERLARMPPGSSRRAISEALGPSTCDSPPLEPDEVDTTHFHVHHDESAIVTAGLTVASYTTSLETAWSKEVNDFGWAEPPPGSPTLYTVVVEDLGPGLYGFVQATSLVGDNPATSWNDVDALASCMGLNEDYTGFPSPPQASLDATTAHEFNHSIQFGYGALTGSNRPDDAFIEGGATWMEDEVFDGSDDNHNYLWPDFTQSMGGYSASPYAYWVVFRALTERFGTGIASGGEPVMQDFWEQTSQSVTSNQFPALNAGLAAKGTTLADAFHEGATALRLGQACGGPWAYPYCLEENPDYAAAAGPPPDHGSIASAGGSFTGSIRDDYAINWVRLPTSGPYPVTLINTSPGGSLRATVACVTGAGPRIAPLPAVVDAGGATTLASFDATGCTGSPFAVITNQSETSANPIFSAPRSYELFLGLAAKTVKLKAKPRRMDRGERVRLRARVVPCEGHEGDKVRFLRKKKRIATRPSNAACVATLRVSVQRTTVFRAVSPQQDDDHLAGTSKKVKVRILPA
jgi:hypothetical protein